MTDWRAQAVCTEEQDPLFFPPDDDYSEENTREAKKICWGCPVWEQCREWATENKIPYGVWGGQSPATRGVKAPKKLPEDVPLEPNWCLGGCGYTMPRHVMAYLLPGQRNYYAQGRCVNCYKRDVHAGDLEISSKSDRSNNGWLDGFTFGRRKNASTDDPR